MPQLTGPTTAFAGDTDQTYTNTNAPFPHALGTRARDYDGNEYAFVQGVASGAVGSWVSFDEGHVASLLVNGAKGRVGVLTAALDATTKQGWAQIYGKCLNAKTAVGTLDNGLLYGSAVPGVAASAVIAGSLIVGAMARGAYAAAGTVVELNYPFASSALG